ncbi:MAG: CBS domain-containing protein [Nitrospirota bacterium]
MKVADIMTKQVHTIVPDKTLKECVLALKRHKVNGLVVMDGTQAIGTITKTDLFKVLLPTYAEIIEDERNITSFEYLEERAHRFYVKKVRDYMTGGLVTTTSNMPIIKAGSLMILKNVRQLPVVDNGTLVGIVTLTDIIHYIGDRLPL